MKIVDPILEPYSITIDSENFTVGIEKEYEKPNGEKYSAQQNQTFHASIEGAIKKVIKHKMADGDQTLDLESYLTRYRKLIEEFSAKFGSLEKLPKTNSEE